MQRVQEKVIKTFIKQALLRADVRDDVAQHVSDGLVQASVRGIDSHGIRLLPHYLEGVDGGRINPNPNYKFQKTSLSAGRFDGDHTFGHAAGTEGMKKAIELAREAGTGHVSVYNSSHFGAAAFFAFLAAEQDMIGMSFTNATPHILTARGKRAFFGNNPICFAAPCEGEGPFCLDMATSVITFNRVLQLKEMGASIPHGTVTDANGNPTTDPDRAEYLFPIGDYKGYGLSMMADILCSLLSGMPSGNKVTEMYNNSMAQRRNLGHYFIAIRIDCFENVELFKKRMAETMRILRLEPPKNEDKPVMAPGDPEKHTAVDRLKNGIPVSECDLEVFNEIAERYYISPILS